MLRVCFSHGKHKSIQQVESLREKQLFRGKKDTLLINYSVFFFSRGLPKGGKSLNYRADYLTFLLNPLDT